MAGAATLPIPLSSFVGRGRELAEVDRLLRATRLLTLLGPGGIGKTRLALEVARQVASEYSDGVALVDLSGVSAEAKVAQTVAAALGVQEQTGQDVIDTLADALRSQGRLLILDNCEHLVEGCAAVAGSVLGECPEVRILATSRVPIGLTGETTFSVPTLESPQADTSSSQQVLRSPAVRLFVERARAIRPDFDVHDGDIRWVAEICRRVDGMPLAIELAAARVRLLSLPQLLERLGDSLRLLVDTSRSRPLRQQTLRATLEWSYQLLPEQERVLLARLSVFVSGWTLDAAEAVCAGDGLLRESILDLLGRLVDSSLVQADASDRVARYRLLETVRQFARERLESDGLATAVLNRHAWFFTAVAERGASAMLGPNELAALDELERDHDNLRAALQWLIGRGAARDAQRLAGALGRFWFFRGHLAEGRAWLHEALAMPSQSGPSEARADCYFAMDLVTMARGEWATAEAAGEAARSEWHALGRPDWEAHAMRQLAALALIRGDLDAARAGFLEGLSLARSANAPTGSGLNLLGLAQLAANERRFEDAYESAEAALRAFNEAGWQRGVLMTLGVLADLRYWQAEYPAAVSLLEQALSLARELGGIWWAGSTLTRLALVAIETRELPRAAELLGEALRGSQRLSDHEGLAFEFAACARVASELGEPVSGLRLASAAARLRGGQVFGGALRAQARGRELIEQLVSAMREQLPEHAADEAWAQGQTLSWEAAFEEAVRVCERAASLPVEVSRPALPGGLSEREVQVLRLAAEGKTNREIAAELILSDKTIKRHLDNIFDKLGVPNRAAAVAFALRAGIA